MSLDRRKLGRSVLVAAVAGILALGAGLRFWDLGGKSLWLDEAQSLFYVDRPVGEMLAAVRARDAHPPLYYLGLYAWMGGSQEAARARALSAVLSTLTLLVFYDLARRLLPRGGALLAVLLLAVSAFQVYFAQEARHYALATFLVTVGWWCLVRVLTRERGRAWPWWLGLALANAAALYTFYYTAFAIVAQGIVLLWQGRGAGRRLARWALWQLVPAGLFAPYLPVVLDRAAAVRERLPGHGTGMEAGDVGRLLVDFSSGGFLLFAGFVVAVAALPLVLLAIVGAAAAWRGRGEGIAARLAFAWLLVPVACVAVFPLGGHRFEPKHLAFAAPAVMLLAGACVAGRRRPVSLLGPVVAMALLGLNVSAIDVYFEDTTEKEDWRGLVAAMADEVREGDAVVFNPPYLQLPFTYYYERQAAERGLPRLEAVAAPVAGRPFRLPARLEGRRVWVVEATSPVAVPNPQVGEALAGRPVRMQRRFDGLVGAIRAVLYAAPRGDRQQGADRF